MIGKQSRVMRPLAVVLVLTALTATAHAASPFGIATPDSPGGAGFGGPLGPFFVQIAYYQSIFYRDLTRALTGMKSNGWEAALLLALSFAYGVFHAAGPGHGKAVLSAYMISSGETVKRGIALSFLSAFVQAVSAILVVGIAAVIFHVTAVTMTRATDWFEILSYALVAVVGAWLLWTKAIGGGHHHHHHHHHVGASCDVAEEEHHHDHPHHDDEYDHHHHHPDEERDHRHGDHGHVQAGVGVQRIAAAATVQRPWRETLVQAWSAILAVGVRPCSGAIIVLVFALSQGLFLAGVAATFVMALGTGLTVALMAVLAVTARGVAVRLAGIDSPVTGRLVRAAEILAAAAVLMLGLVLLGGSLAHGLPG
jgi:nickel/cobalt exporter